jgi:hypothetical protein
MRHSLGLQAQFGSTCTCKQTAQLKAHHGSAHLCKQMHLYADCASAPCLRFARPPFVSQGVSMDVAAVAALRTQKRLSGS